MVGAVLLIMMFMARRIGGIGSPMSFGRSRGRLYAQDDIGITFDDVAGVDEAVEEVREIVDFLKYPEKYQRFGGRIPKGVLLGRHHQERARHCWPKPLPGKRACRISAYRAATSWKCLLASVLHASATCSSRPAAKSPCIIFIDELDALGKSRSGSSVGVHDEREQTLNALLVEMDGFDPNTGIIVIAATNRPETLDPALLRPGRFDRNVWSTDPTSRDAQKF